MTGIKNIHCQKKNEWNAVIFTKQKGFCLLVILLCNIKIVLWIMYDWIYFRVTGNFSCNWKEIQAKKLQK